MWFAKAVIDFLDFRVGLGKIEPRQRKVEAVVHFYASNIQKNKSPNGAVSHHIIKSFFHILRLLLLYLQTMLKKNKSFIWSDEAEAAFVKIKSCMASHPILVTLNFEKQFYISCDASDRAIAGCLFQVIDQF